MKRTNDSARRCVSTILASLILILVCVTAVRAQVAAGGNFKLEQSVIAGGGGTSSSTNGANSFSIEGTIGQSVAGDAINGSPYAVTSGFWNYTSSMPNALGYEADIATRPFGDSLFKSDDLIQLRRFLNGADTPDTTTNNEFQRADSAPYSTRGDGALCSSDLIQLRRYLNGADASQMAGGATATTSTCSAAAAQSSAPEQDGGKQSEGEDKASRSDKAQAPEAARELRVESPPATSAGQTVTVKIRVDALGDESAYSFRLNYNQTVLTNPVINDGTTGAAIVDCDTSVTNRIGCTIEAFPTNQSGSGSTSIREIGVGDNQLLLSITFTIAMNVQAQSIPLTLSNVSTSNDRAQNLAITPTSGAVTITGPTAAGVTISGRTRTANGRGVRNVFITLTTDDGATRTVLSGTFGNYTFTGVAAGQTVILTAKSKRFVFSQPTQILSLTEDAGDIDFIGIEQRSLNQ